jgi:hypothetical protein
MRTVAQILSAEITTVDDLRESLQLSIQLEFSTIPRAEWPIRNGGEVEDTIDETPSRWRSSSKVVSWK